MRSFTATYFTQYVENGIFKKGDDFMKEKFAKLIELKSIITLVLILLVAFVVVLQTLRGKFDMSPEFVGGLITAVITYYFTRKQTTPTT